MWLITTIGFFSAVQKPGDNFLTIRARSAGDLDRLREQFMPSLSPTVLGAGTDYPARATISHQDFATGMAELCKHIKYDNFKNAVAKTMGKGRAHIYSDVWSVLHKIENEVPPTKPAAPAKSNYSYGGVVINAEKKILLREPKNHYDNYVWTFPKGRPDPGETPEQAALREVLEETGIRAKIKQPIPGEYKGGMGYSIYFLMTVDGPSIPFKEDETQSIKWATLAEASSLIQLTRNQTGRARDLKLLQSVATHFPKEVQ